MGIALYMKNLVVFSLLITWVFLGVIFISKNFDNPVQSVLSVSGEENKNYWFYLERKSNIEKLFYGVPGNTSKSQLVKQFIVKTGIPGERPTPLPKLLGLDYWIITDKIETFESPETAPYFLTLNIPVSEEEPFGPIPYLECNGQCNWILPGAFGLHGIGGDISKISPGNLGSSGCIRHSDEDITYLYNLLDPINNEIRYYIEDI
jgi:hypothetical protein